MTSGAEEHSQGVAIALLYSGLAMEIGFIAYNFEAFGHLFPVDGVGAALSVLGIVTFTIGAWTFEDETEVDTA